MPTRHHDEAERPEDRAHVRRSLVQQEIYEQATELFAQRGYPGTSLQDIADAVGLTRPALYHYVRSKDELLARLVAEVTVEAASDIGTIAVRADLTAAERIREIVRHTVHSNGMHARRFQLLIRSEAYLPAEVRDAYELNRRSVLRSLTQVIEEGIADGSFRPQEPRVAALGVLGIANWVAWWYHPGSHRDLDAVSDELADFAVHGLAAEQGRPAAAGPREIIRSVRHELGRLEELLGSPD
jgi:AcrR family transcriptional regulator